MADLGLFPFGHFRQIAALFRLFPSFFCANVVQDDAMPIKRRTIERNCDECGVLYAARAYRVEQGKARCCSRECLAKWVGRNVTPFTERTGEKNGNWKGGVSRIHYRYKLRQVERYPERVAARKKVMTAIISGRLVRGACEFCGTSDDIQAHHEDYSRPLDVMWLCRPCHRRLHEGGAKRAA